MSVDFTTALGRLLSDRALRTEWRRDADALARRLDLREDERALWSALDSDDLEQQAETLVEKRFHEVASLLPRTIAKLGAGARPLFRAHAATFWPEGHRRHPEDADAFARFLEGRDLPICRSEILRLRFAKSGRRWTVHVVPDAFVQGRERRALVLYYRRRGGVRALALYLGL